MMSSKDGSTNILSDTDPIVQFALWGYDLRGSWPLEFAAMISEGTRVATTEWDRPDWRAGELWHGTERQEIPYTWALPWVSEFPPSRRMWERDS